MVAAAVRCQAGVQIQGEAFGNYQGGSPQGYRNLLARAVDELADRMALEVEQH